MVGIAAGVFALMGLAMLMHGIAWLLNDLFFSDNVWIGFMIEALFWFCVAAVAGLFAYRAVQAGAPPTPGPGDRGGAAHEGNAGGQNPVNELHRGRRPAGAGEPVGRALAPGCRGEARARSGRDIERQRTELGRSVEALRGRVAELTDWRRQIREHRRELAIGAAVVGFALGGLMALDAGAER